MRLMFALLFLGSPAAAWEAFSAGPVCLLTHTTDEAQVTVRHDPRQFVPYAIEVARSASVWKPAPTFVMQFEGPARLTITTDDHQLSGDGSALTVTDQGFGNVLAGIALNYIAVAVLGDQALFIPLGGAAPEVAKFQDCLSASGV